MIFLPVSLTGEVLARFFERKGFVDFQEYLRMIFASLRTRQIRVLHFVLDNGPTHAPKQLEAWIAGLKLPFEVRVHWLPIHASWLDPVEIVLSPLQRKVPTPRHAGSTDEIEERITAYFHERNQNPKPIKWSYTAAQRRGKLDRTAAVSRQTPLPGF